MIYFKSFSLHKLCRWYLIHSYLYYELYNSVISDDDFDNLCKELLTRINKEKIPQEFNEFITNDNLIAGTGYAIYFNNLPNRIKSIAYMFHTNRDYCGEKINIDDWLK